MSKHPRIQTISKKLSDGAFIPHSKSSSLIIDYGPVWQSAVGLLY